MVSPHEFYMKHYLEKVDVDHAYGGQCWDLWAQFCIDNGYKVINTTTGWAHEVFTDRHRNGVLENFVEVPIEELRDGDWVFYHRENDNDSIYSTHVAMFRKWEIKYSTATLLHQNVPNDGLHQFVTQTKVSIKGVIGALRPKCYRIDKPIEVGDIIEFNHYNIRPFNNFQEESVEDEFIKGRILHIANFKNHEYKNYNILVERLNKGGDPITILFVNPSDVKKQYLYEGVD